MIKIIKNPHLPRSYSHKGFTLAETLITLVIIGVVAALTVPNLIVKYHKEHAPKQLAKVYSTLAQTTNRAIADNGQLKTWEVEDRKTKEFAEKYFLPYLSLGKDCEYNTEGSCAFKYGYLNSPDNKHELSDSYYRFYLADGTMIGMLASATRVALSRVQDGQQIPLLQFDGSMIYVYLDINGQKGPNVLGKDVFQFLYYIQYDMQQYGDRSGQFLPFNYQNPKWKAKSYRTAGCNKNSIGNYCTAAVMADGWRMSEEYPW